MFKRYTIEDKFNDPSHATAGNNHLFENTPSNHTIHNAPSFITPRADKPKEDEYALYNKLKGYVIGAKDLVLDVLKNTRIEIYACAVAGMILAGANSYHHESIQNRCLRLSFSETEQIEMDAERLGIDVPHVTDFLAKANDFYMKIFEAYNNSWDYAFFGDNTGHFGKELDYHTDMTFKRFKYEFPQLNKLVPALADSVIGDFSYIKNLRDRTEPTVKVLDDTWDDYHNDSYHTEVYYTEETHTDSNGNTYTTTEMHTRQVYDYTDNTYKYYSLAGEHASLMLNAIEKDFPKIQTEGLIMPASKTHAENEEAIYRSRRLFEFAKRMPTEKEYLELANSWLFKSRLTNDLNIIEGLRSNLEIEGNTWAIQKNTAHSYSQRTYDHSYAESDEFLTCENAIGTGNHLVHSIDDMMAIIESAKTRIPELTNMINTYIKATGAYIPGVSASVKHAVNKSYKVPETNKQIQRLGRQIMREAKEGYEELFPNGTPLERAKYWHVPLFALLGLAIGSAIGFGWNYLGDTTGLYGKRKDNNFHSSDDHNVFGTNNPYNLGY
jgi:hypothetical protein